MKKLKEFAVRKAITNLKNKLNQRSSKNNYEKIRACIETISEMHDSNEKTLKDKMKKLY